MIGTFILAVLLSTTVPTAGNHGTDDGTTPAREVLRVTFVQPVLVQNTWLLGTYIIEHDKHRMERGEHCTHLYSVHHPRRVAVKFHCTHIDRPEAKAPTVAVQRMGFSSDGYVLKEFQFKGSTEGHGVPRR